MALKFVFSLTLLDMSAAAAGRMLLALYALNLGASAWTVGVLAATAAIFTTTFSWPAGLLADRYGSRRPLMLGNGGLLVAMMTPWLFPGLPALFFASGLMGLSMAFCSVTQQNLVGLLSGPHERARNFSNFSLALSAAAFMGPLPVGLAIDHTGYGASCLYLALFSAAPLAALAIWGAVLPGGTHDAGAKGSLLQMLSEPNLLRVLLISGLNIVAIEFFQFYIPVYGHESGLPASLIGVVLAMFGAAAFVVRLVLPRLLERMSPEQLMAYAFFICAASFAVMPLSASAAILIPISFLFGLGAGCGPPVTMMLVFSGSAKGRSGEVLGVRLTVNQLTRVVTPVVVGGLGSVFGLLPVFWVSALLMGAGGVLCRAQPARSGE